MTPHRRMCEAARRTKKTLYIITGLYVAIGFVVLIGAALAGDPLSAFLGFLIVSGALAVAIVLNLVLRLSAHMYAIDEGIEDLRARFDHLEKSGVPGETVPTASLADLDSTMLDLTAIGPGDPTLITAATLDRDVFPRLVKTMNEAPPPELVPAGKNAMADDPSKGEEQPIISRTATAVKKTKDTPVALKNLLRAWQDAVHACDLAACRSVFSTLVDTADAATVAAFEGELERLADQIETALRTNFADRVRQGDFAAALAVGEKIATLLPDRPIAVEFKCLRPHLHRRLEKEQENNAGPSAYSKVRA